MNRCPLKRNAAFPVIRLVQRLLAGVDVFDLCGSVVDFGERDLHSVTVRRLRLESDHLFQTSVQAEGAQDLPIPAVDGRIEDIGVSGPRYLKKYFVSGNGI